MYESVYPLSRVLSATQVCRIQQNQFLFKIWHNLLASDLHYCQAVGVDCAETFRWFNPLYALSDCNTNLCVCMLLTSWFGRDWQWDELYWWCVCRSDFMTLPFQAVECFLANITPLQGECMSLCVWVLVSVWSAFSCCQEYMCACSKFDRLLKGSTIQMHVEKYNK